MNNKRNTWDGSIEGRVIEGSEEEREGKMATPMRK